MVERERSHKGGFSIMNVAAVLAIFALLGPFTWRTYDGLHAPSQNYVAAPQQHTFDTNTDISMNTTVPTRATSTENMSATVVDQIIASYALLKEQGIYTPEMGTKLGNTVAASIDATPVYHTFTATDIHTTSDTSRTAALQYQDALHASLKSLEKNTDPEFAIFGKYVETKDTRYLTQLRSVASLYTEAALSAVQVTVPSGVASYHIAILNALEEFAAVLNALADHADDPIGSTALLVSYNTAEHHVLVALNDMALYYANKKY